MQYCTTWWPMRSASQWRGKAWLGAMRCMDMDSAPRSCSRDYLLCVAVGMRRLGLGLDLDLDLGLPSAADALMRRDIMMGVQVGGPCTTWTGLQLACDVGGRRVHPWTMVPHNDACGPHALNVAHARTYIVI